MTFLAQNIEEVHPSLITGLGCFAVQLKLSAYPETFGPAPLKLH